jgi:hypothetical protein
MRVLACLTFCVLTCSGSASPPTRDEEIAICTHSEVPTWPDGVDAPIPHQKLQFLYSHHGAPRWMNSETVLSKIVRATQAWSLCGLDLGVGTQANASKLPTTQTIVIQWDSAQSHGHFGVADRVNRRLTLGPSAFELLMVKAPQAMEYSLQLVISHEIGHFLGLQRHSRRCVDVMSYYSDEKGSECISGVLNWKSGYREYRSHLPTACDIQRCRAINGR